MKQCGFYRKGEIQIQNNRAARALKIGCFLISLALHLVFIIWLYHAKVTIDTNPSGFLVKNVIIAPIEKLYYAPGKTRLQADQSAALQGNAQKTALTKAGNHGLMGGVPLVSPKVRSADPVDRQETNLPSSVFRIVLPEKFRKNPSEGNNLDLTSRNHLLFPKYDYTAKKRTEYSLDLNKYLAVASGRGKTGRFRPAVKALSQANGAAEDSGEFVSWAKTIVDKIQKNWALSSENQEVEADSVQIMLVVEKSGKMRSAEVLESSLNEAFGRSALAAVRMSLPFPELPKAFSEAGLEVVLVFKVHE